MDDGDRALQGPLPADPSLPGLARLEPVHLARTLAHHAPGAAVADARVRHLDWFPGHRFAAHVDAFVHAPGAAVGVRREAVVHGSTSPDEPDGVRWLPDDPYLPLLSVGWARTAPRLAYRPGHRVVLEVGDRVVTGYASKSAYDRAREGLDTLWTALGTAAPQPDKPLPHLLATSHRSVAAAPTGQDDALGVATSAGEVLARLHSTAARTTRSTTSGAAVAGAERAVRLVEGALPDEGRRARAVADQLRRCLPADDDMVVGHGAFTHEQVVRTTTAARAEVVLLGGEQVCSVPRAMDVVSFPAHLVTGRPGDGERAEEALDLILDGYGIGPKHLDWHLATAVLARCARPLQRLSHRWPEQVAALLDAAEEVTRRCAALRV
jgi:hypothetical protein